MVPFFSTFLLLISVFLPSSLGRYTFCYIKGIHTDQQGDIVSHIYTLLFIINGISIVGVGCLRRQHPAVNNQISVYFLVL